jgi:hypothetical protein
MRNSFRKFFMGDGDLERQLYYHRISFGVVLSLAHGC